LKTLFRLSLLCFQLLALQGCKNEPPAKPNIVIIFFDDMGYSDIGCFGAKGYATPFMDQMAAEGAKLTNFYAAQAVCSASRAALLTGCYPNRVGIHNALMPAAKIGLHPDETTLADMLTAQGYATAAFGKWHLGDHPSFLPTRQGFDEYFGIPYSGDMWPHHPWQGTVFDFPPLPLYDNQTVTDTLDDQSLLTTHITERSVDFIRRNKDNPFFLYVPHPQPHVPLFVSDKFKGKSGQGLYGDVMMELDWSVGQILEALKTSGVDDNTLVILTSDNGPWLSYGEHSGVALPLREGKGTSWEGGVRVPAIVRYPGQVKAGAIIDTPMMTIDLLPAIARLTGATLPADTIDGKDIWPIISGESSESPQEAYFFYYHTNELEAMRSGKWKLYFPHTYRTLAGNPGGKNGLPGDYLADSVVVPELYDLEADLAETTNVAAAHPEIVAHLLKLADDKRADLGDKLTGIEGKGNREPGRLDLSGSPR